MRASCRSCGCSRVFSRERKERYAAALELSQTYRGTVMVLSDVVEADDGYTAFHCRSVVELATAVGQELKLKASDLQELEIAALLHDVGKIAIPKEILNKPARLTEAEFELMKTHTLEGQALLDRIGGRLARVGTIVRSCHERWDGRGYPDGLLGEEIPLPARIVFCCDAYSAMTTNRPYRQAMAREDAVAELRANAGSQFEPRIVDALVRVLDETEEVAETYGDAVRAVLAGRPAARATAIPVEPRSKRPPARLRDQLDRHASGRSRCSPAACLRATGSGARRSATARVQHHRDGSARRDADGAARAERGDRDAGDQVRGHEPPGAQRVEQRERAAHQPLRDRLLEDQPLVHHQQAVADPERDERDDGGHEPGHARSSRSGRARWPRRRPRSAPCTRRARRGARR